MKLLDLPPETLATIAAHVSEAPTCEFESCYHFQVSCNSKEWQRLNALRATCRALRDAARVAVAGLRDIEIVAGLNDEHDYVKPMPLSTALSLPYLAGFKEADVQRNINGRKGFLHLVQHVKGLKETYVSSFGSADIGADILGELSSSSHSASLQVVRLGFVDDAGKALLTTLSSNLRELSLHMYSSTIGPLKLSTQAAMSVQKVELVDCQDVSDLFHQILSSDNLRGLTMVRCPIPVAQNERLPDAPNLKEFEYGSRAQDFDEVFLRGGFVGIEKCVYRLAGTPNMNLLCRMLAAMKKELRVLDIALSCEISASLIKTFRDAGLRSDCELHLTIFGDGPAAGAARAAVSVRPLLALQNVVELGFMGATLSDLPKLCGLPKLATARIRDSLLNRREVISMARSVKTLKNLLIERCRAGANDILLISASGRARIGLKEARAGEIKAIIRGPLQGGNT